MNYDSETIGSVVPLLNREYFLPAIQREFKWKPEQIVALFDSLLRQYPIGSFLFWRLPEQGKSLWPSYRFVEHARSGGTPNQLASLDSVPRPVLILDGQQRLTSLLVGLTGHYTLRRRGAWRSNPDAWADCTLCLDLFHNPKQTATSANDDRSNLYYRLAFRQAGEEFTPSEAWYPVGKMLAFKDLDALEEHKQMIEDQFLDKATSIDQVKTFRANITRLHRTIWTERVIAFHTEESSDAERVLDIFVRTNDGGTKLTKSDILMSMLTAKWQETSDARRQISGFVQELNKGFETRRKLSRDFVLKSMLVLSDLPVGFKAENFTPKNLSLMEETWGDLKASIRKGIALVHSFGLPGDILKSANSLIPLLYFVHKHHKRDFAHGTTQIEVENRRIMRRWLVIALLNRVFSGSSDNLLKDLRDVLREDDTGLFPVDRIADAAGKSGPRNAFTFDEELARSLVAELSYGDPMTPVVLSLTLGDSSWQGRLNDVDHIFPQKLLKKKSLVDAGLDPEDADDCVTYKDCLANLQLLTPAENKAKRAAPFEEWMKSRDASFVKTHAIPEDPSLWRLDRFWDFTEAREELLVQRLVGLFGTES